MLAEHDTIEQATGVIMFKMRCTADEAYPASRPRVSAAELFGHRDRDRRRLGRSHATHDRSRSGVTGDQRISPLPAAVARRRRAVGSENTSEITDTAARLHTWWEGLGHEHQQLPSMTRSRRCGVDRVEPHERRIHTASIRWGTDERLQFDVPDELHDFLRIKRRRRGTED
jgi:hypothetical protein